MSATILGVGLAIRAYGGTKPNRPGIVLRMLEVDGVWYGFIAFGTSKPPAATAHPAPVFIERGHHAFESLRLDTPTWFTVHGGGRLRDDDASVRIVGICPPDVLVAVRALYGLR